MVTPSLSKASKISGLAGTAAAIAVAVVAQGYVAGREFLLDGLFLYAVAGFLALRFLPLLPLLDRPMRVQDLHGEGTELRLNCAGARLGLIVLGANLVALALFGTGAHPTLAWILYVASVVSTPVSVWLLSGRPRLRPFGGWPLGDLLALGAVLTVGVAFRLYRIDSLPYGLWWDEAFSGLEALRIMNDPNYRPVYVAGMAQEPALVWYLMAASFTLFGPSPVGLRVTAVAGGLLGILAIFLLARELFGRRSATVAGALVATMAWHVNFSRIAFNAIWSVAFDALAMYFLIQGMRTGRLFSFALAGAALGLGANMYYTSRLMPLILLLYLGHRLVAERRAFFANHFGGLVVLGLAALITVGPLAQFAIQKPEEFNSRTEQITIMKEVTQQRSYAPLVENLRKHLLMFHYEGDGNGRHNLPRAPMLDQVTAALLALGLLMALRQAARPEAFLLLSWLAVMLAGGVFSLAFEAPQGLRTIDEITAVAILASLPVAALWERLQQWRFGEFRMLFPPGLPESPQVAVPVTALAILAVLGAVGAANYQRYFVRQATDYSSWSVFSTAETEIGRQIKALGPGFEVLLGETFINHPTIEFLTGRKNYSKFEPAAHLPLRGIRNAAIFLEPYHTQTIALLRQLYPQAEVRTLNAPEGGPPVLLTMVVRQEEVLRLQGLTASYYSNAEWAGEPEMVEHNAAPRFEAGNPRLPKPPLSAIWRGTLAVPEYGRYLFKLEGPAKAELFIDEQPLLAGGQQEATVLAKGLHALRISAVVEDGSPMALLWQPPNAGQPMPVPKEMVFGPPVSNHGLLGSYYGNKRWEGQPSFQRIDPFLSMRIHLLPLPRPYSVEWRGKIEAPWSGVYRLATESADISWVYVDGRLVVTNEGANRQMREGSIHLEEGLHDFRVRFYDESGHTFIRVYWTPPGGQRELVPRERLLPPQGSYRSTIQAGDPPPPMLQAGIPAPIVPGAVRVEFLANVTGPAGQLAQPRDVATGPDGQLYVVDSGAKRVFIFGPEGAPLGQFQAEFVEPFGVAVAPGGHVLVLDSRGQEPILVFTPDGRLLARMCGGLGMYRPRGIFIDPTGAVYVADTGRSRIVKLSTTGQLLGEFRGNGQLAQPVSVATAGDGTLFVADADRHQLWVVDGNDAVLRSWAMMPSTTFDAPHVGVGPRGELYVSDPRSGTVRVFDHQGRSIAELGAPGNENGQFAVPTGLRIDAQGQLWIADTGNRRVQRWIIRYTPPASWPSY